MPAPLEKPPDQQRIVALLAEQSHLPIADVASLYEQVRAGLAVSARITKFLHIFAIRQVQEILRKRALEQAPPQLARANSMLLRRGPPC